MAGNGGELVVTYGSLQETAGQIKGAAAVLSSELEAMRSAVANVSAGWEGEAKAAMDNAQNQLQNRAREIEEILKKVSERILMGSDHYYATDRKASQLFSEGY
ncbi:WXG100 family type VII secretion target [Streptomyces sp. NPDC001678]|uniref:WXG100 family type VII secretion target n=1 Tax=Streptomyces sp. NPDC001678 TaxID=3364599 RepID=UPI0036B59AEA